MGIGVEVSCPGCGSLQLPIGPRMARPEYCLFPFLCTSCQGVCNLDIHAPELLCSHCGGGEVVPSVPRRR